LYFKFENGNVTKILPQGRELPAGYKLSIYNLQPMKEISRNLTMEMAHNETKKKKECELKRKEKARRFKRTFLIVLVDPGSPENFLQVRFGFPFVTSV
jgi:hypothetical protein